MTDTVQKLMALADGYALQEKFDYQNAMNGKPTEAAPTHRQALQDELVKLFTPLTDEQIAYIAINQQRPEPWTEYPLFLTGPGVGYKKFRSAGENGWVTLEDLILFTRFAEAAHGITGESK